MSVVLDLMKTIWSRWKKAVHRINDVIAFTLMTVVYVTAMAPVALYMRIFRPDPIDRGLGEPDRKSYWMPMRLEAQDLRRSQRPW